MNTSNDRYIPALGFSILTPLYDSVVRVTTRESAFKADLLRLASLQAGEHVLDLACGTGTLAVMAKQQAPDADITGIDGDPEMLARARAKAQRAGVAVAFEQGLSTGLPYADASFDCVLSSLFFHHLSRDAKLATFREVVRVLKPGGRLWVADWGRAANPLMRLAFYGIQFLDGFATTADNVAGLLPAHMGSAGLVEVAESGRISTMFGTMSLYRARRPIAAVP